LLLAISFLCMCYLSWARTARIRITRDPSYYPLGARPPRRRAGVPYLLQSLLLSVVALSFVRDLAGAVIVARWSLGWALATWIRLRFGRSMFGERYLDDVVDAYR
jgi:hypothetical protein